MRIWKNWMPAGALVAGLCGASALSIAPAVRAQDSSRRSERTRGGTA